MLCKNCGNSVKSDFKYCPYCGERFVGDFQDHYGELTPPCVIDEQPDGQAKIYAPAPEEILPEFELPSAEPPSEAPYFVYYPDAPVQSSQAAAGTEPARHRAPQTEPDVSGLEEPPSPSVCVPPSDPDTGWEEAPPPPYEAKPEAVEPPAWETAPPPATAQGTGASVSWQEMPPPPPESEQGGRAQPADWERLDPAAQEQAGFYWQDSPDDPQPPRMPPQFKWEETRGQMRGQDPLSRWEEGANQPRRPMPPPVLEPQAPHIALKLLLIAGVLLLAGAAATGLYFGLIV